MEKFLKMQAVCDRYEVRRWAVMDWIRDNELAAYKIGGKYFFKEEDLLNFEESRRRGVAPKETL